MYVSKTDAEIYTEDQLDCLRHLHSPLFEQHPDEFRRYLDLFYTYCPRRPYNVRTSYDTGFMQKNRSYKHREGRYPLYCHPGLVAKHLDFDHWCFLHPASRPIERFWLAMWPAKRSRLKALDIDNKQNLCGYTQVREGPLTPVVHIPLERFVELKRIYDEFPGHTWCISSETLGLHIWEKYPRPITIDDIHRANRPRLQRIGISAEIHPMPGRCFRRPFGQDYGTITETGLLTDWIDQLNCFEKEAATPSFVAIFRALRAKLVAQWATYDNHGGPISSRWRQRRIGTRELRRELKTIDAWAANGFPTEARPVSVSLTAAANVPAPAKKPSSPKGRTANSTYSGCDVNLSEVCDREWVQNCELWARTGLPCDDSLFVVVSQLARWLYFIEFFPLPEDQRMERIKRLLVHYALTKHNGFISRLAGGSEEQVVQHVSRAVDSGIANGDLNFKGYCAIMRQKRKEGQYRRVICLEGLLGGKEDQSTLSPLPLGFKCGLSGTTNGEGNSDKPILDDPLPPTIHAKLMDLATAKHPDKNGRLIVAMRKRKGEYPLVRFSRRFLNEIWAQGGTANIHFRHLNRMLDMKPDDEDRKLAFKYKNLLLRHGIIKPGWDKFIRRGACSSRYSFTDPIYREFEKVRGKAKAQRA
jgi:hypothetical protein